MRPMLLAFGMCLFVCLKASAAPDSGDPEAYVDNRSSATALVESLYNAINRKEYARAYSYFSSPPAETLEAFAKGYADTESVELKAGEARSEGAAGSIYYTLPVAIRATMTDGSKLVFSGCYTLRLSQPAIQGLPFQPLHIEKGSLSPVKDKALEGAVPANCKTGDAAEPAEDAPADDAGSGDTGEKADPMQAAATNEFEAIYGAVCEAGKDGNATPPESYAIAFNYPSDAQEEPKRTARLYAFPCMSGAYNSTAVYFLADENGAVTPLHFAVPELDIRYRDGDKQSTVDEIIPLGYTTIDQLANATYDERTYTLLANEKWRGPGDASATGTWIFRSGTFSLVKYEVDASYDGKINPETVLNYNMGP